MISFYPEGNQILPSDDSNRTLHKIASLSGAGSGGTGGTGGTGGVTEGDVTVIVMDHLQVYTGAAPPAAPNDPALAAVYYPDAGGGSIQQWDIATQAWV